MTSESKFQQIFQWTSLRKTGDYKPEKLLKVLSMCPALVKLTFMTSKIIHPSMQQQMKVL